MPPPVPRAKLRTSFKNARTISPLYTSGPVAVSQDATKIFTSVAEEVLMTDLVTGLEICRFAGDTENITSLCISPSCRHLVVFTTSLSIRTYDIPATSEAHERPIQPIRVVAKAHDSPVHVSKVDPTSAYVASGSADGVVKVWDIVRGYITHIFRGHGGVVSALAFNYPKDPSSVVQTQKMQLVTASVDTRIRIYDLTATANKVNGVAKPEAVLEGHVSVPRALDVTQDGKWLVSGGRDSVVLLWNLASTESGGSSKKGKSKAAGPTLAKTIPVLERVEAVGFLHNDEELAGSSSSPHQLRLFTGGQKGVVKIWDAKGGSVLFTLGKEEAGLSEDQEDQQQIVDCIYLPSQSSVVSVHADQNILFHSLSSQTLTRQLIGFNDEIVDAAFLSAPGAADSSKPQRDTHVAFATNSSLIRVYARTGLDARLLTGHSNIVLALDHSVQGDLFASGSKDRTARVWAPLESMQDSGSQTWGWGCVAVCGGHAESIGAIAMSRGEPGSDEVRSKFMFTGSQDRTIKMWDLTNVPTLAPKDDTPQDEIERLKSLTTLKAHDKDINSLDVSPNNRFLASGSQDRTAKIFQIDFLPATTGRAAHGEIRQIGICKGHKRGVWCVRFGKAERVLATGSGDKTVKLWNLDDFSCVKTFEGHTNSVLRVDFINAGMQMVSSASDGLLKVWNVREEECTTTLDNHEDKVWAMAVGHDERTIVSGAADSVITFWEDCTEEEEEEKEAKRSDLVQKDQDFMNYLALNDYKQAIRLALALEQPGRLFNLFKDMRSADATAFTGNALVDQVIQSLSGSDLTRLLFYVRDWNASAKSSEVAQGVLFAVMKMKSASEIMKAFDDADMEKSLGSTFKSLDLKEVAGTTSGAGKTALKELLEALLPYTERHFSRMDKLVQESYMVDYVLGEMDSGMLNEEEEMEID